MPELDDDAITVTLPAEEGEAVITKADEVKKLDDPISDLKGQFEQLKGTLNQTTQRLVGTERQLADRDQELQAVRKEVVSSQLDTVVTGIQAAESEATSAEQAYIAAAEAGDHKAMAKAHRVMAAAEAKIQRLREAEGDLKEQTTAKPVKETRQPVQDDPVEAIAKNMAPRAASWIRSHPDYVKDSSKNAKMMATHWAALADGLTEGGDEYFARLDAMVAPKTEARSEPRHDEKRINIRPSAPVAPAGNASGGLNGGGATVTLTQREVTAANDGTHLWERDSPDGKHKRGTPLGTQEFARRKAIMMKQGHYDRTFTDNQ